MDVEGREPLHDLKDIHRLGHPRVEEAYVPVDAARKGALLGRLGQAGPRGLASRGQGPRCAGTPQGQGPPPSDQRGEEPAPPAAATRPATEPPQPPPQSQERPCLHGVRRQQAEARGRGDVSYWFHLQPRRRESVQLGCGYRMGGRRAAGRPGGRESPLEAIFRPWSLAGVALRAMFCFYATNKRQSISEETVAL